MTREEAIKRLKECQANDDTEMAHMEADEVLCSLLRALGYEDVVEEYYDVRRWFA